MADVRDTVNPEMVKYHSDFRVKYDKPAREYRWRNVEIAFTTERPVSFGVSEKDFFDEANDVFMRFLAETTFTTFPDSFISGGFQETEDSYLESNIFKLDIEYSDYDYDKHFDRVILIKDVQKLWDTEQHKAFWDELSRQLYDIVSEELMWGKSRPKGIRTGGRPTGS